MGDEWSGSDWGWDECDPSVVRRESFRGDTLVFQIQVYQPPPNNGAPQNLTGWWVGFMAKKQDADQDSQAVAASSTLTAAPNVVTFPNGASSGLVQVSIGPLNTITLGDGRVRLRYAVKVIDPSGN